MKKIGILWLAIFMTACTKSIAVQEIEKGNYLDAAVNTSVSEFFIKRMSNKTRKTDAISWQILYQNADYVYYGFTKQKSEDDASKKNIEQLFKVNRKELTEKFPGYETITGESVGYNLYLAIEEHRKKIFTEQFEIASLTWTALLEEKVIILTASCSIKVNQKIYQEKYWIEFDKKTFELLSVKKL